MTHLDELLVNATRKPFAVGRSGREVAEGSMSSPNNLHIIGSVFDMLKPDRTLEIGLALGLSAVAIANRHRSSGAAPSLQHLAIDPFQKTVWDDCGILALETEKLTAYCEVMMELSSTALARLVGSGQSFGLIYVDGSHLFEDVFVDLYFCARLLSPGGIILFDDASDPHVRKALRFARTNMTNALKELNLEPFRRSEGRMARLRYRVARAIGRSQLAGFERIGAPDRAWDARFRSF